MWNILRCPSFTPSSPPLVMCIMILHQRYVLHLTNCICVVFWELIYISVSPDITETICSYERHALVLTPI